MIAQVRAERLKVRSTRTTLGLVVGMILLTLLTLLLSGLLTPADGLSSKTDQLNLLATGGVALIFSGLAGVLLITSEYRYGTIRPTFLFTPRRSNVLFAKLATGLLTGLVFGAAAVGLSLGLGLLILSARGIASSLDRGDIALLAGGGLAGISLRGAFGVGLGAIVRNQVAAVIGLLADAATRRAVDAPPAVPGAASLAFRRNDEAPPGFRAQYARGCCDAAVHRLGPGVGRRVAVRDRRDDPIRRPAG